MCSQDDDPNPSPLRAARPAQPSPAFCSFAPSYGTEPVVPDSPSPPLPVLGTLFHGPFPAVGGETAAGAVLFAPASALRRPGAAMRRPDEPSRLRQPFW